MEGIGASDTEDIDIGGIQQFLARTPVAFAVLFGSRARAAADVDSTSDLDLALRFPPLIEAHDRFRLRNRIDAELQAYADGFVDVSDIESLPTPVAYAALQEGIVLIDEPET